MVDPRLHRLTRGRSPIDAGFLIGAFALVFVGMLAYLSTRRLRNEENWVAHTHDVLEHLDRIEIQTRARRPAGDPATATEIAATRALTSENPTQQARLDTLLRIAGGPAAPVLAIIGRMQNEERWQLTEHIARAERTGAVTTWIIASSTVLAIGLMAIALALLDKDLAGRRATERSLRDSESKHRLLMEHAADAILILDSDAVCVEANARAAEITGRPRSEIVGMPLQGFVRGDRPGSPAVIPALPYGQVSTGEFWVLRPDGSRVPVEIRATVLDDGRLQVIARDISERREVERLKGEFVSIVSHELRTPLTSIRGALGLLASGRLDATPEKRQRMLDLAASNTDRLIRLINDILDIERFDSSGVVFEPAECSARQLVEHAVDTLSPVAERAGMTVRWTASEVRIWADPDRMAQTLMNLIDNAIKFSPPGSTVEVSVQGDESVATFAVSDRGRGIPRAKLDSVFDRFQQVDASDSREKGGSGLGLAISRGIVEQHGGRLWVESTVGEGTTFRFTIPLAPARAEPASDSSAQLVLQLP